MWKWRRTGFNFWNLFVTITLLRKPRDEWRPWSCDCKPHNDIAKLSISSVAAIRALTMLHTESNGCLMSIVLLT